MNFAGWEVYSHWDLRKDIMLYNIVLGQTWEVYINMPSSTTIQNGREILGNRLRC